VSHRKSKLEGYVRALVGTIVILITLWLFIGDSFFVNVLAPLYVVVLSTVVLVSLTSLLLWIILGTDRMFSFLEKLNGQWWIAYSVAVLSIPIYWLVVVKSYYS
jgi:hypothetical protein